MDYYLNRKILISIIYLLCAIWIGTKMWFGTGIVKGYKVKCRNKVLKKIYMRILPICIIGVMMNYTIVPILDKFDPNKYAYSVDGVLNGVSTNQHGQEYTIKIEKETYRVPKLLKAHGELEKGEKYKINYYKHSRLVYWIEQVE